MHTHISNGLDGIARHTRAVSKAVERSGVVSDGAARAARLSRIAQAGGGVSASQAFHRTPEYRRQLCELLDIAARSQTAL